MQPLKFDNILESTKQIYNTNNPLNGCPDPQDLIDFVYGDLDTEIKPKISRHLNECAICGVTALKVSVDRHQWEIDMSVSPDDAIAQSLGKEGQRAVGRLFNSNANRKFTSTVVEAVSSWISELWTPKWAGQAVTAVDVPEQQYHFDMGDGEYVDLRCIWEGAQTTQKPKMKLSWSANIFTQSNLWVYFYDSTTDEIMDKICLGTKLEGVMTATEPDLQFDPSIRKWGLRVSVESEE